MVQIQHLDLMRAILYHSLNIFYTVDSFSCNGCHSHWTLAQNRVCDEIKNGKYIITMVTESFKRQYIDTMPSDAVRCRSCQKREKCKIIRLNLDEHCNEWSK